MELEDEFDISIPLNILADVHTPAGLAQAVFSLTEHADGPVR
jgi:acyl carrier protein